MKSLIKFLYLSLIIASSALFAGSVHMINDSPYQLRAVVRGADGTYLGEMIIQSQGTSTWSDNTYGRVPMDEWGQTDRAATPYTVLWYCTSGENYSINTIVATGATVTAQNGEGTRICRPKKKPGEPQQPPQGYLYEDHEPEALHD
jgi:hypothetical protein